MSEKTENYGSIILQDCVHVIKWHITLVRNQTPEEAVLLWISPTGLETADKAQDSQ